ncbi:hypothetical protein K435DRAFT_816308 [Dendrothele bispora CBS 962.96]|uniref:C3H1-type domain-containing protein n=1 Tax=Dendrothele bispora (strain CBS 962.96) TaxID=1314807 RepID=A0A4S8MRF6_DENBC|nr:hypothetical protein K435DRAFT_816308 [Dendrothele bispora CBS 962.96]
MNAQPSTAYPARRSTYINPNYNSVNNKYIRPTTTFPKSSRPVSQPGASSSQVKEVVLGGVAFQSSGRSLVRKDLPKPLSASSSKPVTPTPSTTQAPFVRKAGHLISTHRTYKPKSSRGRRPANRNMTLTNNRRPYQSVWSLDLDTSRRSSKRMKYSDKQCPRFSTTGSCSHGLTCMYQHDPAKIAICWNFLQDNCSKTADTCNLSHDPTPERTPICLHFMNKGRCTRSNCPFPHVNVGERLGVCRDFAVLGYCEKGLDCDKQHVRECPDFAEKGTCSTKGCKLPHVIRANRNRKPASSSAKPTSTSSDSAPSGDSRVQRVTANDAQLGDEYISLTFNESESEESDEEEDEEEDDNDDDDEEDEEEGDDPDHVDDIPVVG